MYFCNCNLWYWTFFSVCSLMILLVFRIAAVIFFTSKKSRKVIKRSLQEKVKTVIVIGSGGHTTEMLYLVQSLNVDRYSPRLYLMASSDTWSEQKVHEYEKTVVHEKGCNRYDVFKIPRSRSVHQSYLTSVFTTLYSTIVSVPVMLRFDPDLILCNGPGTCIPICVIAFMMKCVFLKKNTIIFIESICRVKSMSLSGKILQWFADEILVQWQELTSKCSKAVYIGRVV